VTSKALDEHDVVCSEPQRVEEAGSGHLGRNLSRAAVLDPDLVAAREDAVELRRGAAELGDLDPCTR
jgi:hypothetical protein